MARFAYGWTVGRTFAVLLDAAGGLHSADDCATMGTGGHMRLVMILAAALVAGCGAEEPRPERCRVSLVGSYAYAVRMTDNLPCESWPCRIQIDTELDNPCDGDVTLNHSIKCGALEGSFGPDHMHAIEHNSVSGELTASAPCAPSGRMTVEQDGESYEIDFASEVRWEPE